MISKSVHPQTLENILSKCMIDSGFDNREEILEFLDYYSGEYLDLPNAGEWLAATPRQNGYPINELIAAGTIFSIYKQNMEEQQGPVGVSMLDVRADKIHKVYRSITHMHSNSSTSHETIPGFREMERRVRQYLGITNGDNHDKEKIAEASSVSAPKKWYGQLSYRKQSPHRGIEVYLGSETSIDDVKRFKALATKQIMANPNIRAGVVNIHMTYSDMVNRRIILGISTGNDVLAKETCGSLIGYLTSKGAVEKK